MKARAIIMSIFLSLIGAPFFGGIVYVIIILIALLLDVNFEKDTMWGIFWVATILLYPLLVFAYYLGAKKKSTCPRCKEPFCWEEKQVGSKTLSEAYVSEDVEKRSGDRTWYERQSFRVGKRRYFYETTCLECGYHTSRESVGSYKERV